MEYLYEIIGKFFYDIYQILPDYGFAIIILTIFVKSLLIPIAVKQQKAMVDIQKIQPHLDEIRRKYKNDVTKQNEETMKLYQDYKVNPLAGCLPALIQLPIIIVLYRVITKPLSYILKFSQSDIDKLVTIVKDFKAFEFRENEIQLIQELVTNASSLNFSGIANLFEKVSELSRSMKFLSVIDLGQTPLTVLKQFSQMLENPAMLSGLFILLIPILATLTTHMSSKLMASVNNSTNNSTAANNDMQKSMMMVSPIMTLFFTISFPAGLGLYFLISNLFQMAQQYLLNKFIPKEVAAKK